jgi:hypothetical protein
MTKMTPKHLTILLPRHLLGLLLFKNLGLHLKPAKGLIVTNTMVLTLAYYKVTKL